MNRVLGFLLVALFVLQVSCCKSSHADHTHIKGFPSQVCGTQTFATTYYTNSLIGATFTITTSNPQVTVSPTQVFYNRTTVSNITVSCGETGPVEISFSTAVLGLQDSVWIYCAGIVTIQNPFINVARGSDFVLDVVLTPTPSQEVDIVVDSLTSLIIPGSERMIFAVQQSISNEIFYVPRGPVGPAEIVFKSRSLRDYTGPNCTDLSIVINVLGELSSTLNGTIIGTNVPTTVTVTIDPPASQDVVVDINVFQFGSASQSSLLFTVGEFKKDFNFTTSEFQGQVGCIEFSSTYYQTTKSCFEVTGSFSTDITPQINTFAVETFHLRLSQEQQNPLNVTVTTSSNIRVDSPIIFDAYTTVAEFVVHGLSAGVGFIEFSGHHFLTHREIVEVIEVECNSVSTLDVTGLQCLPCPSSSQGVVCAHNGNCSYSTDFSNLGRCVCDADEGFFGPQCQFSPLMSTNNLEIHSTSSALLVDTQLLPLTLKSFFNFPAGAAGVSSYTAYLQYYSSGVYDAVNPATTLPTIAGKVVSVINSGFILSVVSPDNTQVIDLVKPVQLIFNFDPSKISQSELLQLHLNYWNGTNWVDVSSTCSSSLVTNNIITFTYTISICKAGQYQFFRVSPVPAHVYFVSTAVVIDQPEFNEFNNYVVAGSTGEAPVVPPQPHFNPVIESTSSASVLVFNILGALLLVLALTM